MRTLNETEMRAVAGGVAPPPNIPPGPSCDPSQSTQEKWEIRMWWQERQMNEWFRSQH